MTWIHFRKTRNLFSFKTKVARSKIKKIFLVKKIECTNGNIIPCSTAKTNVQVKF